MQPVDQGLPFMILGLGSDLVDIRRIEGSLDRFGTRFLEKVFTPEERDAVEKRSGTARTGGYAKRFAAKEAAAKALGTGIAEGVGWHDLVVSNLDNGQPQITFLNEAADRLAAMLPPGHAPRLHVSLSDDYPHALAMVIISADPSPLA